MFTDVLHQKPQRLIDVGTEELTKGLTVQLQSPVLTEYQQSPERFIIEKLGIDRRTLFWSENPGYEDHVWDGTVDPHVTYMRAIAKGQRAVAVESATGTQKTFFGACMILWFLACFEDAIVVTTAPKEQQLTLHIWKEVRRLWPRFQVLFPGAELTTLRIWMEPIQKKDVWSANGFACGVGSLEESATRAQGFHGEHMLIITEETPGIDMAIMRAFEMTATAPHNIRLAYGNPDNEHDALHQMAEKDGTLHIRISALDHPNVVCDDPSIVPGATSTQFIAERLADYGEDSTLYKSRVRGICPAEAADALIKYAWLRAARERARGPDRARFLQGEPALGIDVSDSENGDKAAVAYGEGAMLLSVKADKCDDPNQLARDCMPLIKLRTIDPKHVGVDDVGVGAGTYNEFKRLKLAVQALGGSDKPIRTKLAEEFLNLRAQMYWQFRIDLFNEEIAIDFDDPELFSDLTAVTWTTKNGKIVMKSKKDIRKEIGRSTNKGDAVVYWNWVRKMRSGTTRGGRLVTL